MTSVYGVTFIGARMQILNRLKERSPIAVDPVDTYRAACYAAKVFFSATELCFVELIELQIYYLIYSSKQFFRSLCKASV
jgi:DNA-directed RNA polymerase